MFFRYFELNVSFTEHQQAAFMSGLVGGEYEDIDRVFTGQISGLLTGKVLQ